MSRKIVKIVATRCQILGQDAPNSIRLGLRPIRPRSGAFSAASGPLVVYKVPTSKGKEGTGRAQGKERRKVMKESGRRATPMQALPGLTPDPLLGLCPWTPPVPRTPGYRSQSQMKIPPVTGVSQLFKLLYVTGIERRAFKTAEISAAYCVSGQYMEVGRCCRRQDPLDEYSHSHKSRPH